ncbi:alpha/beta family hydrolase [Priestia koreensis]|uniref:alpha/beta family hydrolase n=1 Tax=Priestia koreensis TaxID=284581 RepID=UPI001F588D6A|nr:alpha/beta family hydrolase [Priestia koreensis]UNL86933.1 hypothetical protein IE339_10775 [Priestia koreensis]
MKIEKRTAIGFHGQEVPITHVGTNSKKAAILLPGLGYTNHHPIMHYSGNLLLENGYDLFHVNYNYEIHPTFAHLNEREQTNMIIQDVTAAVHTILSTHEFEEVLFVAKSIGTAALSYILTHEPSYAKHDVIWLTPLLNARNVHENMLRCENRSLAIMGTNDDFYDVHAAEELQNSECIDFVKIEGADHSLEKNNVHQSLGLLRDVLQHIEEFVSVKKTVTN